MWYTWGCNHGSRWSKSSHIFGIRQLFSHGLARALVGLQVLCTTFSFFSKGSMCSWVPSHTTLKHSQLVQHLHRRPVQPVQLVRWCSEPRCRALRQRKPGRMEVEAFSLQQVIWKSLKMIQFRACMAAWSPDFRITSSRHSMRFRPSHCTCFQGHVVNKSRQSWSENLGCIAVTSWDSSENQVTLRLSANWSAVEAALLLSCWACVSQNLLCIYTWKPNNPCLDWYKILLFEGHRRIEDK